MFENLQVAVIGHVTLDRNRTEDGQVYLHPGGPPLYCCKLFSGLKIKTRIVTSYGPDFFTSCLLKKGVYPYRPNMTKTLLYENIYQKSTLRVQKAYFYKDAVLPEIRKLPEEFLKPDILIFTPLIDNISMDYIRDLNEIFKKSMRVILPQGYLRKVTSGGRIEPKKWINAASILKYFHTAIFSEDDMAGKTDIPKLWSDSGCMIVMTKNGRGADIYSENQKESFPSFYVESKEIFDSTGAGDIFSAAFSVMFFKSRKIMQSAEFAHAAAAMSLRTSPDKLEYTYGGINKFIKNSERRDL